MNIIALDQHTYSVDDVERAYAAGDLEGVLSRTRSLSSLRHAVLRARAELRRQSVNDALRTLEASSVDGSVYERIELELIRATVYSRLGRFGESETAIVTARVFAYGALDTTAEMDVLVHHATSYLMRGDYDLASTLLEEAFALPRPVRPSFPDVDRLWDEKHVMARAFELTSFVAAAEGDYASQMQALTSAFKHATESTNRDLLLEVNLAATCCIYACELGRTDLIMSIRAWANGIAWTRDMDLQRFYIARMGAIADALSGDELGAHRHLTVGSRYAPTEEHRLSLMLDRLNLSRRLHGTTAQYLGELDGIVDIATKIDWATSAPKNDGYVVLRMIAEALAPSDPDLAEDMLGRYQRCFALSGRNQGLQHSRRPKAAEQFVVGLIAAARGLDDVARRSFDTAQSLFTEAHCPWRAAIVAVERFALDRSQSRVDEKVLEHFSESWFAKRFQDLACAA